MVLYGSPMGNPNVHDHLRLPLFLAGHAGGQLKGNLHRMTPAGTPMANVLLTMMHKLGVNVETIGDRYGRSRDLMFWGSKDLSQVRRNRCR